MVDLSMSRKLSILAYLQKGPTTLGELANHFARSPKDMRNELIEIFLVEIEQDGFYLSPYDLDLPEDPDPKARVALNDVPAVDLPSMTLGEIISVLALVDTLLVATDVQTHEQLTELRQRLVRSTTDAGYSSVLWPAPSPLTSPDVFNTMRTAIDERKYVAIDYYKSDTRQAEIHQALIGPVEIHTGRHPLIVAVKDDAVRRYRLDRISRAELVDKTLSRRKAKKLLADEETPRHALEVTLITDLSARWVLESIPVESWRQVGQRLHITLQARPEWLGTLLIRLGNSLIDIVGDDARSIIARQYTSIISAHEETRSCG